MDYLVEGITGLEMVGSLSSLNWWKEKIGGEGKASCAYKMPGT